MAIEDSGFEIRDTIMWLYGSGFPKSMNIGLAIDKKNGVEIKNNYTGANYKNNVYGKGMGGGITIETQKAQNEWQGWGTCLKPAFEPIIVARKPFKGSLVDNVIKWGVGGINIDECRVEPTQEYLDGKGNDNIKKSGNIYGFSNYDKLHIRGNPNDLGRFPANTILTYEQMTFDEVCGGFPDTKGGTRHNTVTRLEDSTSYGGKAGSINTRNEFNDSGSACRYFYCAKASKKDRDEGLDHFEEVDTTKLLNRKANTAGILWEQGGTNAFSGAGGTKKNTHPTVKPTELMQYLIRLVTPNGGIILDPFMGSGSTGKAVMYENLERNKNYSFIGIEREEEYFEIAKARIGYLTKEVIR